MRLWPFIEAEKVGQRNVARACELLEVSRSAFYEHAKHQPSCRELSDTELTEQIKVIHAESGGTYGAPRVHKELRNQGVHVAKKRVARLMVRAGLAGRCKKRWRTTTIADPDAQTKAVDMIRRHFGPDVELDRRWVGDITYINHSDQGCQYTSGEFQTLADELGVTLSLSRKGQCWDNAVAESFFATIKRELIDTRPWPTRARLRVALFDYIEGWYNTRRLHSTLGYQSPARYEANIHHDALAGAA